MINKYTQYVSTFLFLIFLRLSFRKKTHTYKDLNFKQINFVDFKIIKQQVIREGFIDDISNNEVHSFNFLDFFKQMGGKNGINLAKKNIFLWFKKYKFYINLPWDSDLTSKRLLNIIYNFDFICSNSTKKEVNKFELIISFHIKRFLFQINRKKLEDVTSFDLVALVLIKNIQKKFNSDIIKFTESTIKMHTDEISFHKSYNILEHAKFLNNLNEIKNILLFFNISISEEIENKILGMTSLLSIYRHDDHSLPLFNNSNNNHNTNIQKIIEKEQFLKTKSFINPSNGLAIYKDSKKVLFFDVIQPTNKSYSKNLSAGSLAIEISALGEKIITNCGGTESGGKNPGYLKYSAAHSTMILNNTNISEIKDNGISKNYPKQVVFENYEKDGLIILSGTHNGYLEKYKKICKRNIKIDKIKNQFNCEDTIISTKSGFDKIYYDIRFHLMPSISITSTKNKKSIIMRTAKNNIWVFKCNNEIKIEKSIIVEKNMAKETNQIVISGFSSYLKNTIMWSLEKI